MPEVDALKVHTFTAEDWRRYAEFHARAAQVMADLAEALEYGDKLLYGQAMNEFEALAAGQRNGGLGFRVEAKA